MSEATIISVGTMFPEEARRQLDDPNSYFYKNSGLTLDAPLAATFRAMLKGGVQDGPEAQHVHPLAELGLTLDDLKRIGRGADDLWLEITTLDKHGKALRLHDPEFIAWLGTFKQAAANANPEVTADVWAQQHGVTLQSMASKHLAGDQEVYIENPVGSRRVVRAGRTLTEPYGTNYGYMRLPDLDSRSPTYHTQPIMVGKDGKLDVFVPPEVLAQIDAGQPYTGDVLIKSRLEDGRADSKVYFGSDIRAAMLAEASSWAGERKPYAELAGGQFTPPIELPEGFAKEMQATHATYLRLNAAQFKAYQYALSEHIENRDIRPEEWIARNFGSQEKFDALFRDVPAALTRAQYHELLPHDADTTVSRISNALRDGRPEVARALEALLKENGTYDRDTRSTMILNGVLSEQEAVAAAMAAANDPKIREKYNEALKNLDVPADVPLASGMHAYGGKQPAGKAR